MATNTLSEDKRKQLDSIVSKMEENKEKPEDIQFVVSDFKGKYGAPEGKKGVLRTAWDLLNLPSRKSEEGLKMISGVIPKPEPKGNMFLDIAKGTPRALGDTLAETAPTFINAPSIVTAGLAEGLGAVSPIAKGVLRTVGSQGEDLAGIAPKAEGALEAAYKDASLLFAKGRKSAGPLYEAAKKEITEGMSIFKGMYKPHEIFDVAKEYIDKGGKLEPPEALMARKAADTLLKSRNVVKDEIVPLRKTFDEMAKASENISKADPAYKRGIQAEALRKLFPQNKYGGASAFKLGIMTLLEHMGLPGKSVMALISPATQGLAATTAGLVGRHAIGPLVNNPISAGGLSAALQLLKQKRKEQRTNENSDSQ